MFIIFLFKIRGPTESVTLNQFIGHNSPQSTHFPINPTPSFFLSPTMATVLFLLFLIVVVSGGVFISPVAPKATIEPCLSSVTCTSLLGYTLYTDLKLSEISTLFQTDTISILAANSITPTFSDQILPSGLFLKIPTVCSCSNGIRQSTTTYKTRPSDTLPSIAQTIYGGLVSSDQIREANGIVDPSLVDAGVSLKVPLPCTCFNGSDNGLPAVYLAYVVRARDTVGGIAKKYFTTVTDLMNANSLGSPVVDAGDILAVPLLGKLLFPSLPVKTKVIKGYFIYIPLLNPYIN